MERRENEPLPLFVLDFKHSYVPVNSYLKNGNVLHLYGVKRKTVAPCAGNKYRQFWAADLVQISGSMFAFKFTAPKKNKFVIFFCEKYGISVTG